MERNPNFLFKQIDDFSFVVPKYTKALNKLNEDERLKTLFEYFIASKFKDSDGVKLCFSLLEFTNNFNIDQIGDILILTSDLKHKKLIDKYKGIVNEVKNKHSYSISEYMAWYDEPSYVLIVDNSDNPNARSVKLDKLGWFLDKQVSKNKCGIKNAILHEHQIQDYLNYYAGLMHESFGLKYYKHYCIIIKPISIFKENSDPHPIGNLYLHFATNEPYDENFYLRLLNDFLILWFRINSHKILEFVKKQPISESQLGCEYCPHLGEQQDNEKIDRIHQHYKYLFSNDSLLNKFKEDFKKTVLRTIDIFYHKKEFDNHFWQDLKSSGISKKKKINSKEFTKILLQREFFKIAFLLFDRSTQHIHNLLTTKPLKDEYHNKALTEKDYRTIYIYFEYSRFLPIEHRLSTVGEKDSKVNIIRSFSDFEIDMYRELENQIIENYPNLESSYKNLIAEAEKEREQRSTAN